MKTERKPRCSRVVVVEGKYDKIRVESALDAVVITTEGFGLFRNPEKRALLLRLAQGPGLVTLLDPDGAGQVIRGHLQTLTGGKGVVHLLPPPVPGKERRKKNPSKEGLLGAEGLDNDVILSLFARAGLLEDQEQGVPKRPPVTRQDLYEKGLLGGPNAKEKREALAARHRLPRNLSAAALLDAVNLLGLEIE